MVCAVGEAIYVCCCPYRAAWLVAWFVDLLGWVFACGGLDLRSRGVLGLVCSSIVRSAGQAMQGYPQAVKALVVEGKVSPGASLLDLAFCDAACLLGDAVVPRGPSFAVDSRLTLFLRCRMPFVDPQFADASRCLCVTGRHAGDAGVPTRRFRDAGPLVVHGRRRQTAGMRLALRGVSLAALTCVRFLLRMCSCVESVAMNSCPCVCSTSLPASLTLVFVL